MVFDWLRDLRPQLSRFRSGRRRSSARRKARHSIRSGEALESRVLLAAAVVELSGLDGSTGFRIAGIDTNDGSGGTVSSAGDVNGDGFDDLILGAPGADVDGFDNAGESYVVFGATGGFSSAIDLSALDGATGFRIDGIDVGNEAGFLVSSAGDVNGDSLDDLVIGTGQGAAHEVYVLVTVHGCCS